MKKRLLLLTATIISISNFTVIAASKVYFESKISKEEYLVYAAVFDGVIVKNGIFRPSPNFKLLLLKDFTVDNFDKLKLDNQYAKRVKERLPTLLPETINSFSAANQNQTKLKDKFKTRIQHKLFTDTDSKEFFKNGTRLSEYYEWEIFYKKYPNSRGIVSVSRIGFNGEKNQALVYFEHWCLSLCGTGNYIVLKKENGNWKIAEWAEMWIS